MASGGAATSMGELHVGSVGSFTFEVLENHCAVSGAAASLCDTVIESNGWLAEAKDNPFALFGACSGSSSATQRSLFEKRTVSSNFETGRTRGRFCACQCVFTAEII